MTLYLSYLKRPLDFLFSGVLLFITSPLLLLVALLIKLEDNGPIFYVQRRLGQRGKIIRLLKFRSMTYRANRIPGEAGELIDGNHEITTIGNLIRRLKIDELPQLFSVLKGDMALIGPRPCLPELAIKFDDNGRKRLEVRPGCSGLAQVNGNINLSWSERWKYDAYYVNHISFKLDLTILMKTILLILKGEKCFVLPYDVFVTNKGRGNKHE